MNEDLIRQCAREVVPFVDEPGTGEQNYRYAAAVIAIETYHARHVAPLVEAAGRLADCASGFSVSGVYFDDPCMTENVAALEAVCKALAPFQQEEE